MSEKPAVPSRLATVHLDAVRGIAAFAVLAYHIRYNFFFDYSQVPAATLGTRLFYTATSFGHDAVIVFFVLSGYLISGTVLKDVRGGSFSWGRYLVNRLTRLYVVLVPGLLLTVFWDQLGMRLFADHPVYTGAPQAWIHDFFRVADRSTPSLFLANLGFLHAIAGTPAYGTAGPLWSLTYEFAYYLIFPAALLAMWPRTRPAVRILCAAAALLLARHFGGRILLAFPIWLLGFGIQLLPQIPALRRAASTRLMLSTAAIMVGGIAVTHVTVVRSLVGGNLLYVDYMTGVICTLALYVLLHDGRPVQDRRYLRSAQAAANVSYTLYVVHLTFVVFLRAALVEGEPWTVTPGSVLAAAGLYAVVLVYAAIVWRVFEARTPRVRAFFSERLLSPRRALKSKDVMELAGA